MSNDLLKSYITLQVSVYYTVYCKFEISINPHVR